MNNGTKNQTPQSKAKEQFILDNLENMWDQQILRGDDDPPETKQKSPRKRMTRRR